MSAYQPAADPTAVVGKRVVAFIIDWVILQAIYWVPFWLLAGVIYDSGTVGDDRCVGYCATLGDTIYGVSWGTFGLLSLVSLAYWIGIFVVLQGNTGLTPGKAVLGLRVVNPEGAAPGPGKAFIRSILLIVDMVPYCIPGLVGLILAVTGENHTRLGDRAAKTFVVGKADVGRPIGAPTAAAQPYGTPVMGAPAAPEAYGTPPPAAPAPYTAPPPAEEPAPAAAPASAEAQWDPARNAYIQWDAAQQTWLQFDEATQQWRAIDQ